jgi:hypothetical protein
MRRADDGLVPGKRKFEYKAAIFPLIVAASSNIGVAVIPMASSYFDHLSPGLRGTAAEVCPEVQTS